LAAGALDGAIVDMMAWRPVKAGDVIYSAAGAVHAIGAGITLIEVQQNVDLTYRLYDYGRPRELHLKEGIAVSDPVPYVAPPIIGDIGNGRAILCEGGKFVIERWSWDGARHVLRPQNIPAGLVPVSGSGSIDGVTFEAGECWMADGAVEIATNEHADVLFAYPLANRVDVFA
jgi:mannose-6-phosphate isomerase